MKICRFASTKKKIVLDPDHVNLALVYDIYCEQANFKRNVLGVDTFYEFAVAQNGLLRPNTLNKDYENERRVSKNDRGTNVVERKIER